MTVQILTNPRFSKKSSRWWRQYPASNCRASRGKIRLANRERNSGHVCWLSEDMVQQSSDKQFIGKFCCFKRGVCHGNTCNSNARTGIIQGPDFHATSCEQAESLQSSEDCGTPNHDMKRSTWSFPEIRQQTNVGACWLRCCDKHLRFRLCKEGGGL